MTLINLKRQYLENLHNAISPRVTTVVRSSRSHQEKAKDVNSIVSEIAEPIGRAAGSLPAGQQRQMALITLQYCLSVVSLEYRHKVWPYEYMAFSRRIGELWEKFCSASWDHPSRPNVRRIQEPSFSTISNSIRRRILRSSEGASDVDQIENDVACLLQLIGDINMKEDEVFEVDSVPHVIDFKSGFGSNEKGNMLRLIAVGRAYKLWNPDTKLMLLVRQSDNNNYLNVLKRSKLWDVYCAEDAYQKIDELTGSDMISIRSNVLDFSNDLSVSFLDDLSANLSNLRSYLEW